MEALKALTQYYESYDEDSRLCSRRGMVEFLTTLRYIEKYLRPGMRILEIGAATGRYSHHFARAGYRVDAVELIAHNIEIFQKNTQPGEIITITQGNAKNLVGFAEDTYDITLLLGPMYHLFTEEEKLQALSEAIRVTKKGGIIFSAYCMGEHPFCSMDLSGERFTTLSGTVCWIRSPLKPSPSPGICLNCTGKKTLMPCGAISR